MKVTYKSEQKVRFNNARRNVERNLRSTECGAER
jgi:hypothetical protein